MPLVVPGLVPGKAGAASSTGTDMKQFWMNQLLGKKLTDGESDETVGHLPRLARELKNEPLLIVGTLKSFARKDLPKEHRVFAHHEKKPSDSARDRYVVRKRRLSYN